MTGGGAAPAGTHPRRTHLPRPAGFHHARRRPSVRDGPVPGRAAGHHGPDAPAHPEQHPDRLPDDPLQQRLRHPLAQLRPDGLQPGIVCHDPGGAAAGTRRRPGTGNPPDAAPGHLWRRTFGGAGRQILPAPGCGRPSRPRRAPHLAGRGTSLRRPEQLGADRIRLRRTDGRDASGTGAGIDGPDGPPVLARRGHHHHLPVSRGPEPGLRRLRRQRRPGHRHLPDPHGPGPGHARLWKTRAVSWTGTSR